MHSAQRCARSCGRPRLPPPTRRLRHRRCSGSRTSRRVSVKGSSQADPHLHFKSRLRESGVAVVCSPVGRRHLTTVCLPLPPSAQLCRPRRRTPLGGTFVESWAGFTETVANPHCGGLQPRGLANILTRSSPGDRSTAARIATTAAAAQTAKGALSGAQHACLASGRSRGEGCLAHVTSRLGPQTPSTPGDGTCWGTAHVPSSRRRCLACGGRAGTTLGCLTLEGDMPTGRSGLP